MPRVHDKTGEEEERVTPIETCRPGRIFIAYYKEKLPVSQLCVIDVVELAYRVVVLYCLSQDQCNG